MNASRRVIPGRWLRRATAVLALPVVGALFLGSPTPALAHDGLVGTSPVSGSVVADAPAAVELDFTGEPLPIGTLVAVTGPDGDAVSEGDAEIRGTTVVQQLTGDLVAGAYRVDWRSTSSDGHTLTGTFDFTVAPAAGQAGTEAPAPPPSTATDTAVDTAADTATTDEAVAPVWWAAGAVVLVALGALLVTRVRRRG